MGKNPLQWWIVNYFEIKSCVKWSNIKCDKAAIFYIINFYSFEKWNVYLNNYVTVKSRIYVENSDEQI